MMRRRWEAPRALAILDLPTRPRALPPEDRRDLGLALVEVGRSIAAGQHLDTGTILVPYQERVPMKVSMDLVGPSGKMWEFDMTYHRLPPEYVAEIAAVAKSFEYYIQNMASGASTGTPSYGVTFKYQAEGDELEGISGKAADMYKGQAVKKNLLYSEAVGLQDAGIVLMQQLQAGAHREIASGQRK